MSISDERLDDFIHRWEKAFGERMERAEALITANRLLEFYRVVRRPLPSEHSPDHKASEES